MDDLHKSQRPEARDPGAPVSEDGCPTPRRDRGNSFCILLFIFPGALLIADACSYWWEQICSSLLIQALISSRNALIDTPRDHIFLAIWLSLSPATQHRRCTITAQRAPSLELSRQSHIPFLSLSAYTQPHPQIVSRIWLSLHLPFLSHHYLLISCQDNCSWIPNAYFFPALETSYSNGSLSLNPCSGLKMLTFPRQANQQWGVF